MTAKPSQQRQAIVQTKARRLFQLEPLAVVLGFLALWGLFRHYVLAAPNSSDLLYYFEIGLKCIKDPFVLNRYFHIYLQKFFIEAAPSPMLGLQNLWAFLMALTAVLVYCGSRLICKTKAILPSLLALAIFFALPAIGDITGVLYVDVTAMAMTALIIVLYLASIDQRAQIQRFLLGILGMVLALAIRTKETTLPAAILLLGLFFDGDSFRFNTGFKKMLWVFVGALTGILFVGILNALVLNDFFFGLRLSEATDYFNSYVDRSIVDLDASTYEDWYQFFFLGTHLLPFLLYLFSGIRSVKQLRFNRRIVWLVPLASIFFVIISIGNRYSYETRFVLPALPGIAMLAPQFLVDFKPGKRVSLHYILFALTLLLAAGTILGIKSWGDAQGLETALFFSQFVNSVLLTLLLAAIFIFDQQDWGKYIILGLLLANLVRPLGSNLLTLFRNQYNHQIFRSSILPFETFKDAISPNPDMRFFIQAQAMPAPYLSITKNRVELQALFDLYFDTNLKRDNFVFYTQDRNPVLSLLEGTGYDQALICSESLSDSGLSTDQLTALESRYSIQYSQTGDLALLSQR